MIPTISCVVIKRSRGLLCNSVTFIPAPCVQRLSDFSEGFHILIKKNNVYPDLFQVALMYDSLPQFLPNVDGTGAKCHHSNVTASFQASESCNVKL